MVERMVEAKSRIDSKDFEAKERRHKVYWVAS